MLKKIKFFLVACVVAINLSAFASDNHSACKETDTSKFYVLDGWKFYSGEVTGTEVSIKGRGKKICYIGVATGRNDGSNTTEVIFEDGAVICTQRSDDARLAAAKIKRTGYKLIGDLQGVSGKSVRLKDCSIEKE
jgi:hypothetical protein